MASIASTGLVPTTLAAGMWQKVQSGSVLAALSPAAPTQFENSTFMVFDSLPKAEFVAEGANKADSGGGFTTKTTTPHKAHVTMRFNQEVKWADEDHQLGVLRALTDAGSNALARALDLGAIHGINPLTGTAAASITENLTDTTNSVEITTAATYAASIDSAVGLVVSDGYAPNGVAYDPTFSYGLATARDGDGRLLNPEFGLNADGGVAYRGLRSASSTTVSGRPEAADTTVRGIVGDFSAFRWGVMKDVGVELIEFGDPDGLGDLKRKNQIALRLEIVYGWAFMDLNAFAKLVDAV